MRCITAVVWYLVMAFALASCAESEKKLYLLEEVRTPVMQFFAKVDPAESDGRLGCLDVDSDGDAVAEKWCQQFPLRPESKALIRVVTLSPPGGTMEFSLTAVRQFVNVPVASIRGARLSVANAVNSKDVPLESLNLQERSELTRALIEEPMRVQEFYFTMDLPGVEDLSASFEAGGSLPGYTISYKTSSPDHRGDTGAVSFFVLPDPATSDIYESLLNQDIETPEGTTRIPARAVAQLKTQARTNVPPQMSAISVASSSARKDKEIEISFTLSEDRDEGAKQRVQWFVTNGELEAEVAAKTKWIPQKTGAAGLFAMVRDLQGGVDFQLLSINVDP